MLQPLVHFSVEQLAFIISGCVRLSAPTMTTDIDDTGRPSNAKGYRSLTLFLTFTHHYMRLRESDSRIRALIDIALLLLLWKSGYYCRKERKREREREFVVFYSRVSR